MHVNNEQTCSSDLRNSVMPLFSPSIFIFCFYQLKEVSVSCLECESVVMCSYGAEEETMKTIPQMAVALKSSSLISGVLNFVL